MNNNRIYGKVTHVVHGHTHKGLVKEFPNTPFGPVTYVNDGAWELDRMNYAKFVLNASSEGVCFFFILPSFHYHVQPLWLFACPFFNFFFEYCWGVFFMEWKCLRLIG